MSFVDSRRAGVLKWFVLLAGLGLVIAAVPLPAVLATVGSGPRAIFVPVTPRRIADTRIAVGIPSALASGASAQLQVTGSVPLAPSGSATVVPAGATAVVMNVTAVSPTRSGFLSVRPGDATGAPTTSSLNVTAGVTLPNEVTMALPVGGAHDGEIQLWYEGSGHQGSTHVLVDVVGYYDGHVHDDLYYRKGAVNDLIFDRQTLSGFVAGDGTKQDSGAYTVNHYGTGQYSISWAVTGLGVTTDMMPMSTVASPNIFCAAGTTVNASHFSYGFNGLGEVLNFSSIVFVFNPAAAPADCAFSFQANFAPKGTIVVPGPAAAERVPSGGNDVTTCVTRDGGTTCTPADEADTTLPVPASK